MSEKKISLPVDVVTVAQDKPVWVSPELMIVDLAKETLAGGANLADQDPNQHS